jgi:hypothetical protein
MNCWPSARSHAFGRQARLGAVPQPADALHEQQPRAATRGKPPNAGCHGQPRSGGIVPTRRDDPAGERPRSAVRLPPWRDETVAPRSETSLQYPHSSRPCLRQAGWLAERSPLVPSVRGWPRHPWSASAVRRTKDADLLALATEHRPPVHEPGLAEEMADIAILLTYLAHDLRVDLETAACLRQVNAPEAGDQRRQVPASLVEKAKGVATKWDRL